MYHWLFFLMTEIEAPLWRIALHMFIYAPEEKSEDEFALAKRDARRMIAVLEPHMQGRDFVVGERVTVADFNAAFTLNLVYYEGLLDAAPPLRAHLIPHHPPPPAPLPHPHSMPAPAPCPPNP